MHEFIRVLLVANDLHLAAATKDRLAAAGFDVDLSLNEELLVTDADLERWSVVLVDLRSPQPAGHQCVKRLLQAGATNVIVLCTSRTVKSEVADLGAIPYLIRPFCDEEGLVPKIKSILLGERKPWRNDLSHARLRRSPVVLSHSFSTFQ